MYNSVCARYLTHHPKMSQTWLLTVLEPFCLLVRADQSEAHGSNIGLKHRKVMAFKNKTMIQKPATTMKHVWILIEGPRTVAHTHAQY
jgi:hypothetical protein